MNKEEQSLMNLLSNKELTDKERKKQDTNIKNYLGEKGGIIIAVSCKDGILLAGVSPSGERTIFQVFHRIGLLALGRPKDYKDIHNLARHSAFSTGLELSKADIDARVIADRISEEIDSAFSYQRSKRGLYRANFIITELGFDIEEDFIKFINFSGGYEIEGVPPGSHWTIYEIPIVCYHLVSKDSIMPKEQSEAEKDISDKSKNISVQDENKKNKEDKVKNEKDKLVWIKTFEMPVLDGLDDLFEDLYSDGNVLSIKEAALFIGLILRLFSERSGAFEMIYLNREMLKRTKVETRKFHHIWNRVTDPNPYKPSDPWQDWEKFIASVYKKIKKGELYPKYQRLIECYETFKKEKLDPKEEEIIKKVHQEELAKLIASLLGRRQEECKKSENYKK